MQTRLVSSFRHFVHSILLSTVAISLSFAQLLGTRGGTMFYPSGLKKGQFKDAIGVVLSRPPDEVVEEFAAVVTAPLIEYRIRYGVSNEFLIEGTVTTIIVSNHLCASTQWILGAGPFGFSIGSDVAYWFGSLDIEGFDNTVSGWSWYPHASIGCDFGRFAVTVKVELNMIFRQTQRIGEVTIQQASNLFNGGALTIYLEQPLWKDNYVALGLKSNFLRYYYVVWPGYPTFNRYSYIPEFYMGFIL